MRAAQPTLELLPSTARPSLRAALGSELPDLRTGPICIECNTNRCDTIEDEICPECWNAHRDASNFTRMFRIACGWTVDNTGGIHPPNAAGEPQPTCDPRKPETL